MLLFKVGENNYSTEDQSINSKANWRRLFIVIEVGGDSDIDFSFLFMLSGADSDNVNEQVNN